MSRIFLAVLLLAFLLNTQKLYAQETDSDSSISQPVIPVKKQAPFRFFRVGIDLSKALADVVQSAYQTAELSLDANYRANIFTDLEGGWGHSRVSNSYLSYQCTNPFLRIGVEKRLFNPVYAGDFDNAFIGLRYGLARVNRSDGAYVIQDPVWGNTTGHIPGATFWAHWVELTGGFRMELIRHIFIGWTIRAKTLLNPKQLEQLPPAYLAGYGKGDKPTAFGYNFYLQYGFGKR